MMAPDVQQIPITELLPQRPPIVMVDQILRCDDVDAVTSFVVRADNIFLDNGLLAPAGIIENMAQSCAARMGCIRKLHHQPITIGYIGDIKNCVINRQPRCSETLTTHIHIVEAVFNLTLAEVVVKVGDEVIAHTLIKVAETDEEVKSEK